MENLDAVFIIDIPKRETYTKVNLIGHVLDKKDYGKGSYGIKIRDITGTIWCNTTQKELYSSVCKQGRINVLGEIIINSRNIKVINASNIIVLETPYTEFYLLDSEMKEQSAKMLMTRIIKNTSTLLQRHGYIEFESKLISRQLPEDNSLEPLLVKYSGFGMPARLIISPSAQVIEFLETTLSRCFTISTSFTQSYRLPDTPSELKVLVAKSLNMPEKEQEQIMEDILQKILSEISEIDIQSVLKKYLGVWPDKVEGVNYLKKEFDNEINLISFDSDIPVIGRRWNTEIKKIYHIVDKEKNILMEGAREFISEESIICTITLYPSQFLRLIKNAPARQIKNLDKLFYGHNS